MGYDDPLNIMSGSLVDQPTFAGFHIPTLTQTYRSSVSDTKPEIDRSRVERLLMLMNKQFGEMRHKINNKLATSSNA